MVNKRLSKSFGAVLIVVCVVGVMVYLAIGNRKASNMAEVPIETTAAAKVERSPVDACESPDEKRQDTTSFKDLAQQEAGTSEIAWALAAFDDPDFRKRARAALDLGKYPSLEAVNLLRRFLNDKEPVVAAVAVDALGTIGLRSDLGDPVYKILEEKARDKGFSKRGHALTMAAAIGKERLLPTIADFIREEDETEEAKNAAVHALSFIHSPACLSNLKLLLETAGDAEIKRIGFETLAAIDTPEALDLLERHVLSSKGDDQVASAWTFARLNRPEGNEILARQMEVNGLEEKTIRILVMSPAAPEIFGQLLQSPTAETRQKISWLKTIAEFGPTAKSEVRAGLASEVVSLLATSGTEASELELEAVRALGELGVEDAHESLLAELGSPDPVIRREALMAAGPFTRRESYKVLLHLIWDEDEETRRMVLPIAEPFLDDSDRELLTKAAKHEDKVIREQVHAIFENILLNDTAEDRDVSELESSCALRDFCRAAEGRTMGLLEKDRVRPESETKKASA